MSGWAYNGWNIPAAFNREKEEKYHGKSGASVCAGVGTVHELR